MREFDFISSIRRRVIPGVNPIKKSIGDDCAVLPYNKKRDMLVTADSLCEGVHFSGAYFRPWEIGARAMAVNISDICAMGGIPRYAVVCIGFPGKLKQAYIDSLYKGIMDYAENYSVDIIGGDTISAGCLTITVTLLGDVEKDRALLRSGARPGDTVFTTGFLGDSYAGLRLLSKHGRKALPGYGHMPVKKHLTPVPCFVEARQLMGSRCVGACMDISDGLMNDLTRICEESGCGAVIDRDSLPVSAQCAAVASSFGEDPADYALYGGEDLELLFTVPESRLQAFTKFAEKNAFVAFPVGRMRKSKGLFVRDGAKLKKAGYKKAWKHF